MNRRDTKGIIVCPIIRIHRRDGLIEIDSVIYVREAFIRQVVMLIEILLQLVKHTQCMTVIAYSLSVGTSSL